jgi:dipeptidyl aminopeptidase/acylaminoacyl peptidase
MKQCLLFAFFLKLSFCAFTQTPKEFVSKPPIDSAAIKNWVRLGNKLAISNDGSYCMYDISNQPLGSKTLVLQSLANNWKKEIPFVDKGFFSEDCKQFCFQRNDTLFFDQLGTDNFTIIPAVKDFTQPKNIQGKYIACRLKTDKQELVIVNLLSGTKQRFDSVEDFSFGDNGNALVLKKNKAQDNTALEWVNLESGKGSEIWQSGNSNSGIRNYSLDQSEKQLAFIVQNQKENEGIWYYKAGMEKAVEKVSNKTIEDELVLAASAPEFSEDGNYIFFKLEHSQKPKPVKIKVSLDVWSYKDTLIQGTKLFQRAPSYDAVIHTQGTRFVLLTHNYEKIIARAKNNSYVVIRYDASGDRFWLGETPKNFLVSLKDGHRIFLDAHSYAGFWFSPDGTYLVYYDFNEKGDYFSYNILTGEKKNISNDIAQPLNQVNEFYKGKTIGRAVGIAGWVEKDGVLVYDNYDIWKMDLTGKSLSVSLTNGYGGKHKTVFKIVNKPSTVFSSKDTLLLTAFNLTNKFNGFFRKAISDSKSPERLVMGPYTFFNMSARGDDNVSSGVEPLKALQSNVWIVSRQSFDEQLNYFYTTDFKNFKKLTDLNPQKDYNWIRAELHSWKQFDGQIGQGILYKPENFDSQKKYPVLINYYSQMSDRLYQFLEPSFTNHNINIPWFVSQGYLVFTPDIYFQIGRLSGESAYNSIVSGAKYLQALSFVDGKRMGINGHSTGGYYTNYLITHTNIFAAALEGAGVSDAVSSYLQLSGVQGKERGTSRYSTEEGIGATLWQRPDLYIESSPILKVDKVTTPLIIFHSKDDTAVPWEQGVELYLALRRLNKRAWMLQYDGQNHGNAAGPYAIDFTIRITQFFDHYLKGAPAPVWMTKGIPASMKGIETGYKLDPTGNCGLKGKVRCKVCDDWNDQYSQKRK